MTNYTVWNMIHDFYLVFATIIKVGLIPIYMLIGQPIADIALIVLTLLSFVCTWFTRERVRAIMGVVTFILFVVSFCTKPAETLLWG